MEADSLNSIVLGPDATPDTEEFTLFIRGGRQGDDEVRPALHRCAAHRGCPRTWWRMCRSLGKRLGTVIGDPRAEGVRHECPRRTDATLLMRDSLAELMKGGGTVYGDPKNVE
ncbi:MAG: hypothetical protein R2818_08200 [Flavobacteriales bacterium]